MRILELTLKAFGPFTDRPPLALGDAEGPGLCVVYGANEAGKSTALRAIRGLLYGIPTRTDDDFVHPYPQLRIGARLRFDDGEELAVIRRKKAKDSLYTADDQDVLRSERLAALVEAVPEPLFERFYGLDHRVLRDGSAALLQDDGEVGRALFGAGLGVANLGAVLEGLEREAAELFAPRASKPRINTAIADWSKAQKEIGQQALDPRAWAAQEQIVRDATVQLEALDRELEETRRERSRCERLRLSLPALARRTGAARALEALEAERAIVALPDDFAERLRQAREERRSADERRRRAESTIERERAARERLVLSPEMLSAQDRIEALHQRVGGYRDAVEQLPRRESSLAGLDEDIESLAGEARSTLTPERLRAFREAVSRAASTRSLASEGLRLEDRAAKRREELAEALTDLELLQAPSESDRPPACDTAPLRLALGRALALGPIDAQRAEARERHRRLDFEVERLARGLGLEPAGVDALAASAFPDHEWIDSMRERFADQARQQQELREQAETLAAERRRVDEELRRNASQGAVPQLEDLERQRAQRDQAWRALRRSVIEAEPEAAPARTERTSLADRFERELAEADGVGDRLRIDANRVALQASLEARSERLERDREALEERQRERERAGTILEAEWREAWKSSGVEAGTPEAMRGWRRGLDDLCDRVTQRFEAAQAFERDARRCDEAIGGLRAALALAQTSAAPDADRLQEWVARAETTLERLVEQEQARRQRLEAIRQAEERATKAAQRERQAAEELERWRLEWSAAAAFLGLEESARPDRALERLDAMARLLERLRERDELAGRVEAMRRIVARFEAEVEGLVAQAAPGLADHPPAAAIQRLHRMLGDVLKQQALLGKSAEALAEAEIELEEAAAQARASEEAIAALCALADVREESAVDEALRRWREAEERRRSLRDAETELSNLAEGRTLAEVEAESAGVDSDALAARIAGLDERIRQRSEDQKRAIAELRSHRDLLESMNGSARVAELAEAAESKLALIRRDVDRYVQLRLAKQILEAEIERYREQNQAPLLARSGEIFEALTRGAYPRIASEIGTGDAGPRLVAVGPTGAETPVSGLSAGTRDQLFLAIRLASFEEAQSRGEPMPLVADDILIEFDDERSRATLEVLAELGRKSQILLFSHHLHIAEIAGDLGHSARVVEL